MDSKAPYTETVEQAGELASLRRFLSIAEGAFSLGIAVCNSPALRDYLINQVQGSEPNLAVATLRDSTVDVFGKVKEQIGETSPSAIFVIGLEQATGSAPVRVRVLKSLNASRELWEQRFPCPVVFWMPAYVAAALAIHAPDFWRYRSHRFEFAPAPAGLKQAMLTEASGDLDLTVNLSVDEKQFRIAELEQRLAEVGDDASGAMAQHAAVWLNELGVLYREIGELDKAKATFRQALELNERLGRREGMASNYGNLGNVLYVRGDLDGAEEMYRKALDLDEKLGRREGMAKSYANLGNVMTARGDLDGAETMHRKALELNEQFGALAGKADGYRHLGIVMYARGDLDGADRMFREALALNEQLGRRQGMSGVYANLGNIMADHGDLDGAERMYRKGLEIAEHLGSREGMANLYGNLGLVMYERGDTDAACEMWTKARDLFEQMGAADDVHRAQALLDQVADSARPSSGGEA